MLTPNRSAYPRNLPSNCVSRLDWLRPNTKWPNQPEIVETKEILTQRISIKEVIGFVGNTDSRLSIVEKLKHWRLLGVTGFLKDL